MKVLFSLILCSFITFSTAFAQSIQSEFTPSERMTKFKEGDLVEATLRFWPIENADLEQFKKLEKTMLFNALYLAQVINLGPSTNNADVVELKGLFIVQSAKPQPLHTFKYNETIVELRLGNITIEESSNKQQDFYILSQSLNASKLWMIFAGLGVLLLIILLIKREALKNLFNKVRPNAAKKMRKQYDVQFRKADKREDFELIYQEKDKWLTLLADKTPAHMEFFKILNQYQFKKEWNNEEYTEVRASFDVIRRSFEK